jgi:protein-S-isoprenylcysteine O-methyltransferase Ste14
MIPKLTTVPAAAPESSLDQTPWQRFLAILVRYRVRITIVVFIAQIAEDVLSGTRPHSLFHINDLKAMLGLTVILSGLALRSWAAGILHKATVLTTSGPYALIRHPLYVGSFMMMIGFCILIDDVENIWFVLGPFAFIFVISLLKEERVLSKKFGPQWQDYSGKVPRFLPYRMSKNAFAPWNGQQWLNNREYNAVAATMLGLIAVQAWSMHLIGFRAG